MALYIVETETGMSFELKLSSASVEAIRRHYRLAAEGADEAEFCKRLASEMEQVLQRVTNWRLKEPTPAQLAYAVSLCRQLQIELPEEAARSRGEMQRFLAIHALRVRSK